MRQDTPTLNETLKHLKIGSAKLWMLLVGVNQYQQPLNSLNFAVDDCQGLKEALEKATEEFEKVEILAHYDGADLHPTLQAVGKSLEQITSEAGNLDVILFYFAGHSEIEKETQQPFLCLADTQLNNLSNTGLAIETVLQKFRESSACKQLVLLDACHSGAITNALFRGEEEVEESRPDPVRGLSQVLSQEASHNNGFCAILSGKNNQKSWEYSEIGHGVFTYFIIKGLNGAAADTYGVITGSKLHQFVHDKTSSWVAEKSNNQHQQNPMLITVRTEAIVLGYLPYYHSELTYDDKLNKYKEHLDKEIKEKAFIQKEIEQLKKLEDFLPSKSCEKMQEYSQKLGLNSEDIELENKHIVQKYKELLIQYKQRVINLLREHYSLAQGALTQDALQELQKTPQFQYINSEVADKIRKNIEKGDKNKVEKYIEDFHRALYKQALSPNEAHQQLEKLQQQLNLGQRMVELIEKKENENYQRAKESCKQKIEIAIPEINPLNSESFDVFLQQQKQKLEQELGLNPQTIQLIGKTVITKYKEVLKSYSNIYTAIKRSNQLIKENTQDRALLKVFRQYITKKHADIIESAIDNNEELFPQSSQQQSQDSSSDINRDFLEDLWNDRDSNEEISNSIEAEVEEESELESSEIPIEEDNESLRPYYQKFVAWINSNQDTSQLLQGQEYEEALNWLDNYNSKISNKNEKAFIRQSIILNSDK